MSPSANQPQENIWTARDVALYLKIDIKTVYRLTKKGALPGFRVGGQWRFTQSDIFKWIASNKNCYLTKNDDG